MNDLQQIDLQQEKQYLTVNENFKSSRAAATFGIDYETTAALTFGYKGGPISNDGAVTDVADGTVALTASSANYVERTPAGVVSKNTTGFSAEKLRLYKVTTNASGITAIEDHRDYHEPPFGLLSVSVAGGAGDSTLTADQARAEIINCTGALTGNRGLILPQMKRRWIVVNNTTGSFTLTAKTSSGAGVAVIQGKSAQVMWDGTNVVDVLSFLTSLALAGLLDLSHASAGQVKFPATQNASSDANTLDDYEEGDCTLTIGGSSTAGSQTYSAQVGRYQKAGKRVFVDGNLIMTAKDAATAGNLTIFGLPFAAVTLTNYATAAAIGRWSNFDLNAGAGYTTLTGSVITATSTVVLLESGDNVAGASLTDVDLAATSAIRFSVNYETPT